MNQQTPSIQTATHSASGAPLTSSGLVTLASAIGLTAFLYPFVLPAFGTFTELSSASRGGTAAIVFASVSILSLIVLLVELSSAQSPNVSAAKVAALLGAIVAVDASLRLVPSFGGASPIFLLIILAGSVFGARLGFLTGSMTLLLSAFLTGGIGPWLPYQMLGAGWVGLGAGWVPHSSSRWRRLLYLALYGIVSALFYGILLNLYSWPFAAPDLDQAASPFWSPELGFSETIERYGRFYLVTSLSHDLLRAAGNAALVLALGGPIIKTLERAHRRLSWHAPSVSERDAPASHHG